MQIRDLTNEIDMPGSVTLLLVVVGVCTMLVLVGGIVGSFVS